MSGGSKLGVGFGIDNNQVKNSIRTVTKKAAVVVGGLFGRLVRAAIKAVCGGTE